MSYLPIILFLLLLIVTIVTLYMILKPEQPVVPAPPKPVPPEPVKPSESSKARTVGMGIGGGVLIIIIIILVIYYFRRELLGETIKHPNNNSFYNSPKQSSLRSRSQLQRYLRMPKRPRSSARLRSVLPRSAPRPRSFWGKNPVIN